MSTGPSSAFLHDPGAWADPAGAAALIVPGLQTETARRLLHSPRLAARASRLLAARLGDSDSSPLDRLDGTLAAAPADALEAIAFSAGAVWHARRVRAVVLGADIAALCHRCGEAARDAALRHGKLAPDDTTALGGQFGELEADIAHDGRRCVAAWIDTLPVWAAARVRLKWRPPPLPPLPDAGQAAAVRIVRTLAAETSAALERPTA
jgi:hypothetical protein